MRSTRLGGRIGHELFEPHDPQVIGAEGVEPRREMVGVTAAAKRHVLLVLGTIEVLLARDEGDRQAITLVRALHDLGKQIHARRVEGELERLGIVLERQREALVTGDPPYWRQRAVVYASGVAEIAGGAGVLHPRTRKAASLWSVATLLAVFPANVHMALHPERYRVPGGRLALYLRLPVQALFIAWAIAAGSD
jgi:uncharacterized membrane protein